MYYNLLILNIKRMESKWKTAINNNNSKQNILPISCDTTLLLYTTYVRHKTNGGQRGKTGGVK